jgi:hypothetical protein
MPVICALGGKTHTLDFQAWKRFREELAQAHIAAPAREELRYEHERFRALEDAAHRDGRLRAGQGSASLVLSASSVRRVVDGIVSGIHVRGESHFALLESFADERTLELFACAAEREAYLRHEQGDVCLVLPGALARKARAA